MSSGKVVVFFKERERESGGGVKHVFENLDSDIAMPSN